MNEEYRFHSTRGFRALVSQIDVFPTVCEYLEIDPPDWLQGESLMPLIMGETERARTDLFTEQTYHGGKYEPKRCIRTDRYKLIRLYDDYEDNASSQSVVSTANERPKGDIIEETDTTGVPAERGLHRKTDAQELLFDMYFDPLERTNLSDDPEYREIRLDLARKLDNWMEETGDPLRLGPVKPPNTLR